ncbi:MAG: holin family protein [Deltaproteobacteria bacterium]|nr:holin family protein [Deltaproteobacteria bacterium]
MSGIAGINIDVGSVLNGIGAVAKDIRQALTGELSPEKKADLQMQLLMMEEKSMQAQMAVNVEEAKSPSLFTSGWRPAVGWVCVMALFYNYIGMPLFHYIIQFFETTVPPLPGLDTSELMTLLFGLLGMGGYRTYEKVSGVVKSRG